jgi:hypothetical protein
MYSSLHSLRSLSSLSSLTHVTHFIRPLVICRYSSLFTVAALRKVFTDLRLEVGNFMHFLDSLNNQGYLLKKGPKAYQLRTADF